MFVAVQRHLEQVALLHPVHTLFEQAAVDWVTNDVQVVFEDLDERIELVVERLVEQVALLYQLEAGRVHELRELSRTLPFRHPVIGSDLLQAFGEQGRHLDDLVDGQLQFVAAVIRRQDCFALEPLGISQTS